MTDVTSNNKVMTVTVSDSSYSYYYEEANDHTINRVLVIDGQTRLNLSTGQVTGPLPKLFKKQANLEIRSSDVVNYNIHYLPQAGFHCLTAQSQLYNPVYYTDVPAGEIAVPQTSVFLVNNQLYGQHCNKYNYKTVFHHGLVMNDHIKDGRHCSIPLHHYELAVILNAIEAGLHLLLLK